MIRKLKILLVATMALAALGVFVASAHAAEEKFHCNVEPCRLRAKNDGTGKTGHQVFVLNDTSGHEVSFTCPTITAEGTSSLKSSSATLFTNINYGTECSVNGQPGITIVTTGCGYEFLSAGGATGAGFNIVCETGKQIEVRIPNCTFTIAGGQKLTGARYHNIGKESETTTEITSESNNIKGVAVTILSGGTEANCHVNPTQALSAEFITGNVIATGETDVASPVMGNTWWA